MLIDARSRIAAGPTEAVVARAGQVILGKERQIRLAMACILARGHLLIEDVPGVGKTTLSHALARLLGLDYQRIQFTSDLLPADIIGVSIFDRESCDVPLPSRARSSRRSSSPTRSTARARRRKARCSRRWRSTRSRPRARRARCPSRSS